MVFEFENFKLRRWRPGDEDSLVANANNKRIWLNVRDSFPYPYTLKNAKDWISVANLLKIQANFAIEVDEQAVGGIGVILKDDIYYKSAEIGYWLGEEYWNRGIMSKAVTRITEFAFERFDICRLFAEVFAWNPASARVLEKSGFTFEGRLKKSVTKDGQTIDSLVYAYVR